MLNPHLGWAGRGADKPLSTFNNPNRNSWGQLFSGRAHDHQSLFTCARARLCVWGYCPLSCDSSPTRGLHRAMEALFRPAFSYKARCVFERGLGISPKYLLLLLDAHCRETQCSAASTNGSRFQRLCFPERTASLSHFSGVSCLLWLVGSGI